MWVASKRDPKFIEELKKCVTLDRNTGSIKFKGMYALLALNISWNYKTIRVPYSHLVWLLEKGEWPEDGKNLDHINDDPMDNRPSNLNELTHTENQRKRRGRLVNRNYGTG